MEGSMWFAESKLESAMNDAISAQAQFVKTQSLVTTRLSNELKLAKIENEKLKLENENLKNLIENSIQIQLKNKNLKLENEKLHDTVAHKNDCTICCENQISRALTCGHIYCSNCTDTFIRDKKCPVCAQIPQGTLNIYF